jgi:hypothetical protein
MCPFFPNAASFVLNRVRQALAFLQLCSKETLSWKTFIFENPSEGITSPFANILRKIRALLSTVGADDGDLGEKRGGGIV